MRAFTASLATETNTFAPMPTGLASFHQDGYFPAGTYPDAPSLFAGPLWAARRRAREHGWQLVEGLVAGAQPSGITTRLAFETLRDELLADLRAALPVDMVLLGLHGAMVADGYDDCEGDLLARVRQIVGPAVVVGAELDPHNHLSAARPTDIPGGQHRRSVAGRHGQLGRQQRPGQRHAQQRQQWQRQACAQACQTRNRTHHQSHASDLGRRGIQPQPGQHRRQDRHRLSSPSAWASPSRNNGTMAKLCRPWARSCAAASRMKTW